MDIASEQYVSITTSRRDGRTVSSPVWIAPLADGRVGFTTGSASGKVKRIVEIDLPRPRDVNEIRLTPHFVELHTQIWHAMKDEVLKGYAQSQRA